MGKWFFIENWGVVGGLLGEDFWERGMWGSNWGKIVSFQVGTGEGWF